MCKLTPSYVKQLLNAGVKIVSSKIDYTGGYVIVQDSKKEALITLSTNVQVLEYLETLA